MNILKATTCCMVLLLIPVAQSSADIVTPVSATPSSEFAAAVNLINGSGLSGVGPVETQLHDNDENHMWQTFAGTSIGETVEFELDANYDLSSALIWQYNGLNANGMPELDREIDGFELAVSPDLVSPFVSLGTFNLAPALDQLVGGFNEPAQMFNLDGADDARRLKLTILSIQGGGLGDGSAGLSEVRFVTVVPEPMTCTLLAMGGLSLIRTRRRRR